MSSPPRSTRRPCVPDGDRLRADPVPSYGDGHGLCLGPRHPGGARRAGLRVRRLPRGAPPAGVAPVTGPTELPVPDTADVRSGPEVSDALLAVLPLLGEWHGEGQAAGADGDHRFGQWMRFTHDGRGFL